MSSVNIKKLKTIAEEPNSCIITKGKKLQLLVKPMYFNDMKAGVLAALEEITVGYNQQLGGLIIGYENVKIYEGTGWMHSTNPYIHIHVHATFYIFAPTKGLRIKGVVNELGYNQISFLIHSKYNVVYHGWEVPVDIGASERQYLSSLNLTEGDTCTLALTDVAFRDFLPHLLGYPVQDGDSVAAKHEELDDAVRSDVSTPEGSRKKVRFSDDNYDDSDSTAVEDLISLEGSSKINEDSDSVDSEITLLSIKKKKKSKKDRSREYSPTPIKIEKRSPNSSHSNGDNIDKNNLDKSSSEDCKKLSKKELKKLLASGGSQTTMSLVQPVPFELKDEPISPSPKTKKKKSKTNLSTEQRNSLSTDNSTTVIKIKKSTKKSKKRNSEETEHLADEKPKKKKRKIENNS